MIETMNADICLNAFTVAADAVAAAMSKSKKLRRGVADATPLDPMAHDHKTAPHSTETDLPEMVSMADVRTDGGTQARVALDKTVVQEYADALEEGAKLPPITLYYEESADVYWLADGFHRYEAHRVIGRIGILAFVKEGTQRDAKLHAAGANAIHGLRRTNADKRYAVTMLLEDPEWVQWSDSAIARQCGVSQPFVATVRAAIIKPFDDSPPSAAPTTRTVTRNGTTYEQKVKAKPTATPVPPLSKASQSAAAPADAPTMETTTESDTNRLMPEQSAEIYMDILRTEIVELREELAAVKTDATVLRAENDFLLRMSESDEQIKLALDEVARYKALAKNGSFNSRATDDLSESHEENAQLRAEIDNLRAQLQDHVALVEVCSSEKEVLAEQLRSLAMQFQEAIACYEKMREILEACEQLPEMPRQLQQALELSRMFESRAADAPRPCADAHRDQHDVMQSTRVEATMHGEHVIESTGTEAIDYQSSAADNMVQVVAEYERSAETDAAGMPWDDQQAGETCH